jgi:hypothetical protein
MENRYKANMIENGNNFDDTLQFIRKQIEKGRSDWFSCKEIFKRQGRQGVVGIADIPELNTTTVFKIPQYLNHLTKHEFNVLNGLNSLSPFCPHFCRSFGLQKLTVDKNYRKVPNPFQIDSNYPIEVEVLFMEHIDKARKLHDYIRSQKVDDDVVYSAIKQVLMAIAIAQRKKRFAHYDLQSNNILLLWM